MEAIALKPIRVKSTGQEYLPGDVVDAEPGKLLQWSEKGLVRIVMVEPASPVNPPSPDQASGQPMTPNAGEDGLKTQNPWQSGPALETVRWTSPLFGELEAPVLARGTHFFSLEHPLTGEVVRIPNEWEVSMEERSAILEYDGGLPREEADRRARIEFFGLFREGGNP